MSVDAATGGVGLVCVDVDGTLVGTGGAVHPRVWEVAARVRAAGIRLAVCSGRPAFGLARGYAERLEPDAWHVFQNGASVVHLPGGESRSVPLAPEGVAWLVSRARETGRPLELYTDTEYAVESTAPRAGQHAALLGVPFRPRALDSLAGPVVRAQWLLSHAEAETVLGEAAHPTLNLARSTSPVMPDTSFVNITPAGVDKASSVRVVAAAYGVPLERVMMVGDAPNDLGVLEIVGVPVAMGNAEEEVKAVARHHVGHVDDGGLAEALELALRL